MIPIGQWLAECAAPAAREAASSGIPANPAEESQNSTDRLVEEAFARGKLEAQQEFEEQFLPARLEARQRCQDLLDHMRGRWLELHVEPLGGKFSAAVEEMELRLSEALAKVLKPFLSKAAIEQSLGKFKGLIANRLADAETCPLRLRASKDTLDMLGQALKERGINVAMEEAESPDLLLEAGNTVFESQAAAWIAAIEADSDG